MQLETPPEVDLGQRAILKSEIDLGEQSQAPKSWKLGLGAENGVGDQLGRRMVCGQSSNEPKAPSQGLGKTQHHELTLEGLGGWLILSTDINDCGKC